MPKYSDVVHELEVNLLNHKVSGLEKELSKYKQAYEVLRESNKFYADELSWFALIRDKYKRTAGTVMAHDLESFKEDLIGGKKAREAEKKVNEIMEEK